MFCETCLQSLAGNLEAVDYAILEKLQKANATMGVMAIRREDLLTIEMAPTVHSLRESLIRLRVTNLIRAEQRGASMTYWLTDDGRRVLQWFLDAASKNGRNE